MNRVHDFKMESRPYGDGYTNMVGIACGWCRTEAWHPAKNGGWAVRIFRATGWKIGNKRTQDRCPTCFGKAKNARRHKPDNPVLTPEVAKAIKATIAAHREEEAKLGAPSKDDLMNTTVLIPSPMKVWERVERPGPEVDPSPPEEPQAPQEAAYVRRRGAPAPPGYVFHRREHAMRSANTATSGEDGVDYFAIKRHNGWTWVHAADVTPAERAAWRPIRKLPSRRKETPMTAKVVPMKDPMPTPTLPAAEMHADPARKPTRDERNAIHDELTKVYDPVAERYSGSDSDKVVSERLDVPRVWVTEVRAMFFGDHDRNQAAVQKIASLDKAIELAKTASQRLMQMAAEAETLEQSLVAARKLLED